MSNSRKQWLVPTLVMGLGIAAVIAISIVAAKRAGSPGGEPGSSAQTALANYANQDVDPGSPAGDTPAPNFVLRDQLGRETSLQQFRGKVVLIAFVDSQCTDICPLTTESMVKALRLLGPAAADVQLLGINANPLALKVSDLAAYTDAHDMQGKWRFLTGTLPQLKKVWHDYHVYVAVIHHDADHQPAMVLVDTVGREHKIYMTQMSYEGVAPQAQVLADDMAKLLPGPPTASQEVSLKYVQPLQPTSPVQLTPFGVPKAQVQIGGAHVHLLLFFASWLDQDSNVRSKLAALDDYASAARRKGWPSPVAVDELPTESSPASAETALAGFAAGLRTPVVEDANGRLGDGYQVEDLPWYTLSSSSGKIVWSHDGWLSAAALERQVGAAVANDSTDEHATSLSKSKTEAASTSKVPAAD